MPKSKYANRPLSRLLIVVASLLSATTLSGCVVVGASSNGGWFIWPGGLGLVVIILLAIFILRGRRS